ncbi:hypothetical protein [Spongorhabdus nitratireducens]
MTFLKSLPFRVLVLNCILFCNTSYAAEREDLYELGRAALKNQDYISAVKYLYAFSVVNSEKLDDDPAFKNTINTKIMQAETALEFAVKTNNRFQFTDGGVLVQAGAKAPEGTVDMDTFIKSLNETLQYKGGQPEVEPTNK